MTKDTTKIVEELQLYDDFKTFYDENKDYMFTDGLPTLLRELMEKHGLKKTAVIRASELSETYAYQIFSGLRRPEREKLLCLAIGMALTIEEIQTLLKTAGYTPLYVKLPEDSVVLYGLCKKLSVVQINDLLFENGLKTLR